MEDVRHIDDRSGRALDLICDWDGRIDKDSAAAAIYNTVREEAVKELLKPVLGPLHAEAWKATGRGAPALVADLRAHLFDLAVKDDRRGLPASKSWPEFVGEMLGRALDILERRLGPDMATWKWGDIHQLKPVHPLSAVLPENAAVLDPRARPRSGDGDAVHATGYLPVSAFDVNDLRRPVYV